MLVVHLRSFGCKRLNLIESFWHGPCASLLYSFWPLLFGFLFSLFLGFALHNIHAFHSRSFLFIFFPNNNNNKKGRKKKEANCVLHYFSWFWKQGWSIYSYTTCLCTLFSLDELIYCTLLVKLCCAYCVGKMFIVFDHFVLILKSHVFDYRTWTFGERHK